MIEYLPISSIVLAKSAWPAEIAIALQSNPLTAGELDFNFVNISQQKQYAYLIFAPAAKSASKPVLFAQKLDS